MSTNKVALFTPYPFTLGQKIRITGDKRGGDWEVIGLTERKVILRCPISGREFEWDRFCYLLEEKDNEPWPAEH
ncbi:MAG: hypothetical protein KKD63_02995 [Proteobacteria bacterium]|nr:hypothetical protein [Desulfobulbaceae bacterium]MBU4151827.1 hypothetical protein [Pseudomonadota bacterium]MDP2104928.1 hypothetical protein [Desulfobulbaceae bacterium]